MRKDNVQMLLVFLAYYGVICFSSIYYLFAPFYEGYGATPAQAGLFLSVAYMLRLCFRPLGSLVTERLGIRRTLISSSVALCVAAAGIALSLSNFPLLIFFRAMSGMFQSVFIVAAIAYESMLLDENNRGSGFALFATGSMLPLATVVPLAEWFIRSGRHSLYLWSPAAVAVFCLGIGCFIRDVEIKDSGQTVRKWGTYRGLFSYKGVIALLMTGFILSVSDGANLCIAYLSADRGITASFFMIASSLSSIAIRTVGYRMIAKIPRLLLTASSAGIMGLALFFLSYSATPLLFALNGLLFGISIGIGYPTGFSMIGDIVPKKFHPKATGGLLLAMDLGWILTPLIFGAASPLFGPDGSFRILGLTAFIAAFSIHFMFWLPIYRGRHAGLSG